MFSSKNKNKNDVYPWKLQFLLYKSRVKEGQHYISMFSWCCNMSTNRERSDQTLRMHMLIWTFSVRLCHMGLFVLCASLDLQLEKMYLMIIATRKGVISLRIWTVWSKLRYTTIDIGSMTILCSSTKTLIRLCGCIFTTITWSDVLYHFNPFVSSGLFYLNSLNRFISNYLGCLVIFNY